MIYRATKQHAFNLAKFVSIYKALLLIQKKVNSGKERDVDTFIAGLIGGYIVFGERNAVNEQVCFFNSTKPLMKLCWYRSYYMSPLEYWHLSFHEQFNRTACLVDPPTHSPMYNRYPRTLDILPPSQHSPGVQ